MVKFTSTEKDVKTLVEGKTEKVELWERKKGLIEIDIHEGVKEDHKKGSSIPKQIPNSIGLNRFQELFEIFNKEMEKSQELRLDDTSNIFLDKTDLIGLNNRRSEMSILALILKTSTSGAKKTQILYEANLSGSQMKNYLNFLVDSECLREEKDKKGTSKFFITSKGKVFLSYWTKIVSLLESDLD